jgi:NhaP-type Na+/H+ or K+/H+ antiporter
MTLLLIFAATLMIAVLISDLAERSVLSAAVLFLAAGFGAGRGLFGPAPQLAPQFLGRLSEIALFSVLFTDGIQIGGIQSILKLWRLPGRALLIGMPLTIIGIALGVHYLLSVQWVPSFLVAAVLSPTDPVFVAAIFRFEAVPDRIKRLLNIESGLNDGLALPIVLLLLAKLSGGGQHLADIAYELLLGIAIGVVIPWLGIRLERTRFFKAVGLFEPLNAFAIGLLVLAICYRTGANLFLGAYAAGISVASFSSSVAQAFERFGELIAELLKLAALMIFGAVIAPELFASLSGRDYVFILLATFAVRPVAVVLSLLGTELSWREMLLAGWFGPKGFASVVYSLLILQAGMSHLAHLVGLAVAASIVVYSSTDVLVGRWFRDRHVAESRQVPDES